MLGCISEPPDDNARQSMFALQAHQMLAESHDVEDQAAGAVGNDLDPIRHAGTSDRRLANAEILRALRIGGDDEAVAAVIDSVLVPVPARLHETWFAVGASASIM